jgi:predicted transcriptional regulator
MYACPVKPKKFKSENISESCFNIIQVIQQSNKISKKDLLNSNFEKTISKDTILYELKWLLNEGYIREYKNGRISIN